MIQLVGFDQVLQAVRNLPDTVKAKTMKAIMVKNQQPIVKGIKAITPKSNLKTRVRKNKKGETLRDKKGREKLISAGNLQKSIGARAFGKGTQIDSYAGIQKKGRYDGYYGFWIARGSKYITKNDFITRGAAPQLQTAANNLGDDITKHIVANAQRLGLNAR